MQTSPSCSAIVDALNSCLLANDLSFDKLSIGDPKNSIKKGQYLVWSNLVSYNLSFQEPEFPTTEQAIVDIDKTKVTPKLNIVAGIETPKVNSLFYAYYDYLADLLFPVDGMRPVIQRLGVVRGADQSHMYVLYKNELSGIQYELHIVDGASTQAILEAYKVQIKQAIKQASYAVTPENEDDYLLTMNELLEREFSDIYPDQAIEILSIQSINDEYCHVKVYLRGKTFTCSDLPSKCDPRSLLLCVFDDLSEGASEEAVARQEAKDNQFLVDHID